MCFIFQFDSTIKLSNVNLLFTSCESRIYLKLNIQLDPGATSLNNPPPLKQDSPQSKIKKRLVFDQKMFTCVFSILMVHFSCLKACQQIIKDSCLCMLGLFYDISQSQPRLFSSQYSCLFPGLCYKYNPNNVKYEIQN